MAGISIIKIHDNLIVPIQQELHDHAAAQLQENILKKIHHTQARGLLIDVSAISIIDSFLGRMLADTAKMAKLMGTETVLVGLKKEVILTIMQMGFQLSNIHTTLNIEDGLVLLESLKADGSPEQTA